MDTSRAHVREDCEATRRLDRIYRPEFLALDVVRIAQAEVLRRLGFGPAERPYCISATGPQWRLRDYGGGPRASLLVIGAPIKRPYIWDLAPSLSALGYCLDQGFHLHLIEWTPPKLGDESNGLDDYVDAISQCLGIVAAGTADRAPILLGHSLGGTLAAIFAAYDSASPAGLVVLGAPLCFGAGASPYRDDVIGLTGPTPLPRELVPGSFLSQVSALASPSTFVWSRLADSLISLADALSFETHLRVEHWALDEVALHGQFVGQVLDWLYREDRLYRGCLPIRGRLLGPHNLTTPTLAVVDAADGVAPRCAVEPFLRGSPAPSAVLEYPGESGVALQHLALLVGRGARVELWPQIIAWIDHTLAGSNTRKAGASTNGRSQS